MRKGISSVTSREWSLVMVWGAWVDPPWPMSTTASRPSQRACWAKTAISAGSRGGMEARVAQPMRFSAVARASGENA